MKKTGSRKPVPTNRSRQTYWQSEIHGTKSYPHRPESDETNRTRGFRNHSLFPGTQLPGPIPRNRAGNEVDRSFPANYSLKCRKTYWTYASRNQIPGTGFRMNTPFSFLEAMPTTQCIRNSRKRFPKSILAIYTNIRDTRFRNRFPERISKRHSIHDSLKSF